MLKQNLLDAKTSLRKYSFPVDIIIETTNRCNLDCIMCPQSDLTRPRGEMSFDVWKKIIDEIAAESITSRIWCAIMGEPLLLGNKIITMIEYASKKGLNVHLNTNATLMNKDMTNALIESGVKEIIIGLDGTTKETYSKIRCGGDYEKVVQNSLYLLAKNNGFVKVIMQFIEMDENCHEIELFKKYWLSKGATVKLRPRLGWGLGREAKNLVVGDDGRDFACPWLIRTVSIHCDGKMAQCDGDYDGKHSPGDVKSQTIKEVWDTVLKERREKHWNLDFSFPLCTNCKDWQAGRSYYYEPND